ncbi:Predicted acetyltransferase, GNAT superfamily [Actinopolymorpha singaporensis]|uniref:Predicted acetyltransferase, GNAT superfamily n=2 Tax=Actinopolymorpha singaporensis TaxID=117157 RepID=A0A1H1Y7M4_9ACTN|nr:Predicted acetyltransferase, GNAT superfamily [Actinopolymorpha singaporensis]
MQTMRPAQQTQPAQPAPGAAVTARPLRTQREREEAVGLYRKVFGLGSGDPAMTPKLLVALQRNGGSALGAFDPSGRLVGFTYGFVGTQDGATYHYSQAAVVDAAAQGKGVGRVLKRAQAAEASRAGVRAMRWAYDPMLARNAHFNLDVLGARGRWFVRDYYGLTDAAGRSDRVIVEWRTDSEVTEVTEVTGATGQGGDLPGPTADPVARAGRDPGPEWGTVRTLPAVPAAGPSADIRLLAIPARWGAPDGPDPLRAGDVRDQVADALENALDAGYVLTSCRRINPDTAVYLLARAVEAR